MVALVAGRPDERAVIDALRDVDQELRLHQHGDTAVLQIRDDGGRLLATLEPGRLIECWDDVTRLLGAEVVAGLPLHWDDDDGFRADKEPVGVDWAAREPDAEPVPGFRTDFAGGRFRKFSNKMRPCKICRKESNGKPGRSCREGLKMSTWITFSLGRGRGRGRGRPDTSRMRRTLKTGKLFLVRSFGALGVTQRTILTELEGTH